MTSRPRLDAIVVCGPSGVGKGTLLGRLRRDYGGRVAVAVSHTTRAPRPGERDGCEYHFVDRETMTAMVARGELLESANVHGELYGTSAAAVRRVRETGRVCLLEIDVQGAAAVRALEGVDDGLTARFLFLIAPLAELQERLRARGTEDPVLLKRRLATAQTELDFLEANPNFFNAVIVNDEVDQAYARLVKTINAFFREFDIPPLEREEKTGGEDAGEDS